MVVKEGQVYTVINDMELKRVFNIPYPNLCHFFGDSETEVTVFSINKREQHPIQITFPTGTSRKCTIKELLSFAKLKEEGQECMKFRLNEKYAVKLPVDHATAFDMGVANCDPLVEGSTLTVIRYNPRETYPYQVRFSNGYVEVYDYEQLTELIGLTGTKDTELKEENKMSNINVNITYVVTGWDEEHAMSHTLYAGYDESLGEKAVNNSTYEDFEKEVWYNGNVVQVYTKPRIESQWYLDNDKVKHTLDEALTVSSQLINHLDKLNAFKELVNVTRGSSEVEDKFRDIANNVNTIKHIMEDL